MCDCKNGKKDSIIAKFPVDGHLKKFTHCSECDIVSEEAVESEPVNDPEKKAAWSNFVTPANIDTPQNTLVNPHH